jgi:hypothetical protein
MNHLVVIGSFETFITNKACLCADFNKRIKRFSIFIYELSQIFQLKNILMQMKAFINTVLQPLCFSQLAFSRICHAFSPFYEVYDLILEQHLKMGY